MSEANPEANPEADPEADPEANPKDPTASTTPSDDPSASELDNDGVPVPRDVVGEARRARVQSALFKRAAVHRFGRYVVLRELGRGGMGTVLEAYDDELDRRVALKLLHPHQNQDLARRLRREAQGLAQLSHPNVVQVFEVSEVEGQPFVALELVCGPTLDQWRVKSPAPGWRRCVEVYLGAGRGLAAVHAAGLVHRDFKPSNCILDEDGRARILDFGLVVRTDKATTEEIIPAPMPVEPRDDALNCSLTQPGATMGTLPYMPLEQFEGRTIDALSDQFSFCVSLYEAVYAQRPFPGTTIQQLAASLSEGRIRLAPPGTKVPARLRQILLRGLATEPERRWPSMDALLDALERVVTPRWKERRLLGSLALGAGLGLGLGMASLATHWEEERKEQCAGSERELDGIWDQERRAEVRAALEGSGRPYADDTWTRVDAQLSDYGQQWVAKHTEICEATRVSEVQTERDMGRRMRCMDTRRTALQKTVDLLAQTDTHVVDKATTVVAGLPLLSRCDDLLALETALPRPEAPSEARRVDAVRERLLDVRVQIHAGKYQRALLDAEASLEAAKTIGYGPLMAEALMQRSLARNAMGLYSEAAADLERAYLLALRHDHRQIEATATNWRLWIVGRQLGQSERAQTLSQTALALARRRDTDPATRASIFAHTGMMLRDQGKLDQALTYLELALTIRQAMDPEHPRIPQNLNELGITLTAQGKPKEALDHYQRAVFIQERTLGPDHPELAKSLGNIGVMLMDHQDLLDDALAYLARTRSIQQRVLPPEHPDRLRTLGNIALALERQGKLGDALELHRQVLAKQRLALAPEHIDRTKTLGNIAVVLHRLSDLDGALVHYRRALAGFQANLGPRHPVVAHTLDNIGLVLAEQGDLEGALLHYRQGLGIHRAALGPDHPVLATAMHGIGEIQLERGELRAASDSFEHAVSLLEGTSAPNPSKLAPAVLGLAKVELRQNDPAGAQAHAQRALALFESGETFDPRQMATARFVLARALWAEPEHRLRARRLAEYAHDDYTEAGAIAAKERATVERWLDAHPLPKATVVHPAPTQ
ncbi:MAG: serine/threonine-protein kinase [Myxococcota bacterium]